MKFIFTGDFHLYSAPHRSRLDNSPETGLNKLRQIFELGRKYQAAIIFPGDFLHNNSNSNEYILRILNIIEEYPDVYCCCIAGNHECRGDDPSSYEYSQMQFLYRGSHLSFLQDTILGGVHLRAFHAYRDLDTSNPEEVDILVCHHFLAETFNDKLICKPSEMRKIFPNLKYILAGHDHAEYGPGLVDGVVCIRPGSVMRIDSSQHRQPKVCLFDTDNLNEIYSLELEASPWDKLFSLETKEIKKELDQRIDGFVCAMSAPTVSIDSTGILREKLNNVKNPQVREYIKQDLSVLGYNL